MADETTVFSKDGTFKADVKAWKNNYLFYKSIGTEVNVYHREETKNIWGSTVTDWVDKAVPSIEITNVYRGTGPGASPGGVAKSKTCPNTNSCELKEWAVGGSITVTETGDTSEGGGAILEIDSVNGSVVVVLPSGERLTAQVSASSALSDNSIWG